MRRNEVLGEAGLTLNLRGAEYGTVEENFGRIADIWSVILEKKITRKQVALCMIGLKVARLQNTPEHEDSWVDIAGYAALGSEVKDGNN